MSDWSFRCAILLIIWNLLLSVEMFTQAADCKLGRSNPTTLVWDYNSESFMALNDLHSSMNASERGLHSKEFPLDYEIMPSSPRGSSKGGNGPSQGRRSLSPRAFNRSDVVNVTECGCANPSDSYIYYCPREVNYCEGIRGKDAPNCLGQSQGVYIVSKAWPFTVTIMFLLLGILFFSFRGRCVWGFIVALFYPKWNIMKVEWLLQHNPNIAHQLIVQAYERQRQRVEDRYLEFLANNPGYVFSNASQERAQEAPKVLRLRTKVYRSSKSSTFLEKPVDSSPPMEESSPISSSGISTFKDEASGTPVLKDNWINNLVNLTAEEELALTEDHACAICYASMVDGEKVGALACGHMLHVDCLKVWLKRRNVCPLCLTEAATVCAASP